MRMSLLRPCGYFFDGPECPIFPMRKEFVLAFSAATMLAGFGLTLFGLLWAPELNLVLVTGGAVIAALAGYLFIDELAQR